MSNNKHCNINPHCPDWKRISYGPSDSRIEYSCVRPLHDDCESIERKKRAEEHDNQMREEGAKAEREKWQAEREKLISVIDEKIANARVAAANAVLDELAQMYANVPEQFLNGTYRLHLEWKAKIESLRHGQKQEQHGTTAGGR